MWKSWINQKRKNAEWRYYDPKFECDEYNREMLQFAPWSGHRRFAYDFVANIRPETIVELGSFYGCSTFAFAQATKDHGLPSVIWAVDIWEAFDSYTKDSYKENVYGSFMNVKEKCYAGDYIYELKMKFDEARPQFETASIDLLHIDGSHNYEDVKHDFEEWFPCVKSDGVIFFHDIGENIVNGDIMGSRIFWNEIKRLFPMTLEFSYSCGLGILCLDKSKFNILKSVDFNWYITRNDIEDAKMKDLLCQYYFSLRDKEYYIGKLREQVASKDFHLNSYKASIAQMQEDYEKTVREKEEYIQDLVVQIKVKDYHLDQYKRNIEKVKSDYEKTIFEKDSYINQLLNAKKEKPLDNE